MNIASLNARVQYGRGVAASKLGQTYDVYSLTAASNGQVVSGTPRLTGFPASLTHWGDAKDIENHILGTLSFGATCDNRYLRLGDILVGYGYGSENAMYAVAQLRPFKQTVLVRTEQPATITRPTTNNVSLNPTGPTMVTSFSGLEKMNELVLTLVNGTYSFQSSGTSAMVPVGIQPTDSLREYPPSKIPTDTRRQVFIGYIPLLPGVILEENDVISSGSAGDRYRIAMNYIAEYGLEGQIVVLEKLLV